MSEYTTLRITKLKAKEYLLSYISANLEDDFFLENILSECLKDRLYNIQITYNYKDNDDEIL